MSNPRGVNLRNILDNNNNNNNYELFFDGITDMSFNLIKLQKLLLKCVTNDSLSEILLDVRAINLYLCDVEYQISKRYDSLLSSSSTLKLLSNNNLVGARRLKKTIIKGGSGYEFSAQTLPALLVIYLNRAIDDGRFDRILECDSGKKCFYFVNKSDVLRIKELEEQRKEKQRAKSLSLKNDYIIYFWGSEEACRTKILEWEYLFSDNVSVVIERS